MNPLSWKALADILEIEVTAEKPPTPKYLPDDRAGLRAVLSGHQPRLNELCETWVNTGQWPMMLPIEWWFLQFLLWHGVELANRLACKNADGETLPVPTREVALRWLIADSRLESDLDELAESVRPGAPGSGTTKRWLPN